MAGIIFGCIILILVGWAIVKGKYAPFILIASGVAMLAFSVFFDTGTFMPKKALPTGNDYLNIIEFIRYMFSTRLAGLGLLIMTMVGFASYMTHIGANDAFVNIAIKPLSIIKSPYALVFLAFLLGKAVSMVITSAVGHAVLEADRIREALTKKGYELLFGSTTNQIFLRLTNAEADRLGQSVEMSFWERLDDEHVVKRIATSWATDPKDVDALIALF